ncbi:MAG: hypothetical protein C5B52_00270 [Bacteroidetes bacterium]|nr:MAG: hypothetical protein C5B52_00270 [Bacteroidota bacterium]
MKNRIILCTLVLLPSFYVKASDSLSVNKNIRRINLIISSKTKKIDPAPLSFQFQAWVTHLFRRKTFFYIVAASSKEMIAKAQRILDKEHAMIGNIWFDSHGHFAKRKSLFEIGEDEFNYQNMSDTSHTKWLAGLSKYCDEFTKAGIGSCYAGATYSAAAVEAFPARRMNGDSLMMSLSHLLNRATVYASESWVMSGPGVFSNSYALSGHPGKRKFKDKVFEPVWQKLGVWNCYEGSTGYFHTVNTVSLDKRAAIQCLPENYISKGKHAKCQKKHLEGLKTGRYNLAAMYQ